tara:strand:- start:976 stop:1347 length:372 start_codon:yes stop_codon:yes gene_type:complete
MYKRSNKRRTNQKKRKTHRKSYSKKTKTKTKPKSKPSVHNPISPCVKLFKKYGLTNQSKTVRWINKNHPDHAVARGSVQSKTLMDDYKFITGCFAMRKQIYKMMKSKTKSKKKSKSKSVKAIQ